MPRGNRYFVPGQIYHLTHRCHNRQFLLRFAHDKNAYRKKLREAVSEFELALLDYCQTSNHVHLLAFAEETEQISGFMQMVEGEFAQSYNRRKHRSGAYWDDRFHSTTIQSGQHLVECMTYIALNMGRCGVVQHPREWDWCGYHELMGFRKRFRVLDITTLLSLLACDDISDFRRQYEWRLNEKIARSVMAREPRWTEAIAVGSESFVRQIATLIKGRQSLEITGEGENWSLKEGETSYHVPHRVNHKESRSFQWDEAP